MSNYICKIANLDEMNIKWDYEIENAEDKENWIIWKKEHIKRFQKGYIIPYYGVLNGKIICECTAALDPSVVKNKEELVDDTTAYLTAFRTIPEYQGKGYFSKLFNYMINDLKSKGYKRVTIGVEPSEKKNKEIYFHYGFNKHIKDGIESFPDGTETKVEYYEKNI